MIKLERINPQKMAAIYWVRLGKRAFRDVDTIAAQYRDDPATRDYWIVVRSFLAEFSKKSGRTH